MVRIICTHQFHSQNSWYATLDVDELWLEELTYSVAVNDVCLLLVLYFSILTQNLEYELSDHSSRDHLII